MKKLFLTLAIGGMSFSFACDKCNLSNTAMAEQLSLQDYKLEFLKKLTKEEERMESLKLCINGKTIQEISDCEKKFYHPTGCDCQSCSSQQNSNLKPIFPPIPKAN